MQKKLQKNQKKQKSVKEEIIIKIGFVILHYQNSDDTINCINTILELNNNYDIKIKIYLVDNKSPNGTGNELKEKYKNDKRIKTILMDKNYGFSYSNNIGYKYAKKDNCNLIIVCNNDILFYDKDFLNLLYSIYEKEKVDIIIPDLINYNGFHQNPMKTREYSFISAFKNCVRRIVVFLLLHIPIIRVITRNKEIKKETKWLDSYYKNEERERVLNDIFVPIGAFIIYGKNWIKNEEIAFPSKVFLYGEEYFLTHYIKTKKYKMKYYSVLKVKHLEGRSTDSSSNNDYQKMIKKNKYCIISLIKYMIFLIGGN